MIFFLINNNLNIKLSDGTMVSYKRGTKEEHWDDSNIYCTTYSDFMSIQTICKNIKEAKYKCRHINRNLYLTPHNSSGTRTMPKRLGVEFKSEYYNLIEIEENNNRDKLLLQTVKNRKIRGHLEEIYTAINSVKFTKKEIKVAIIGASFNKLGEIVNFCTALRILHEVLSKKVAKVKLDLCLQGSESNYYKRDKEIYESYSFINSVRPLSLSIQEFCEYDYFVDTSSINESIYHNELPYVDHFLRHFGVDYESIPAYKKHNEFNLRDYKVDEKLKEKLELLKKNGKLLLFHPYSAKTTRSVPIEISKKLANRLENSAKEYQIITTLKINGLKNDNVVDLSSFSKSFFDFVYIISQVEAVICVDTLTYHISDALFIPTVALFTDENLMDIRVKYYDYVRAIYVKQERKSLSKFAFKDDTFSSGHHNGWLELKMSKIIKLLEKIG